MYFRIVKTNLPVESSWFSVANESVLIACCGDELKFFRRGNSSVPTIEYRSLSPSCTLPLRLVHHKPSKQFLILCKSFTCKQNFVPLSNYEVWAYPEEKGAATKLLRFAKGQVVTDMLVCCDGTNLVFSVISQDERNLTKNVVGVASCHVELYKLEKKKNNILGQKKTSAFEIDPSLKGFEFKLVCTSKDNRIVAIAKSKVANYSVFPLSQKCDTYFLEAHHLGSEFQSRSIRVHRDRRNLL